MRYFDLHCDTPFELYHRKLPFGNALTHVNAQNTSSFSEYAQVFAVWTNPKIAHDEAYTNFFSIADHLARQEFLPQRRYLAVEGLSLLDDKIERLNALYDYGVRLFTLVWKGECCIGGAHDAAMGLTDFGKNVVSRCLELDALVDISHASDKMTAQVLELAQVAGKPIIATHSNSRTICNHSRNLPDDLARGIFANGGVIGISLAPQHLTHNSACTAKDVVRHIKHYCELGGEKQLCLGCDFDGIDTTPQDIRHAGELYNLANELIRSDYSETFVNDLFFDNASQFFARFFKNNNPF